MDSITVTWIFCYRSQALSGGFSWIALYCRHARRSFQESSNLKFRTRLRIRLQAQARKPHLEEKFPQTCNLNQLNFTDTEFHRRILVSFYTLAPSWAGMQWWQAFLFWAWPDNHVLCVMGTWQGLMESLTVPQGVISETTVTAEDV